jgi:hypothetical protein
MKKIINLIIFLGSTMPYYSQVMKIEVLEFEKYKRYGDQSEIKMTIDEYDIRNKNIKSNCYYIIDIGNKKSRFYSGEDFISEVDIDNIKIEDGTYIMDIYDSSYDSEYPIKTNIIINTNENKEEFIYYYYNEYDRSNNVLIMNKFIIHKNS